MSSPVLIHHHGCWTCEYDWEVSSDVESKETVLSVLFDSGAQRHFSSVRITLLFSDNAGPEHRAAWQISPRPSSLAIVTHASAQGNPETQNDPTLPICHVVFRADRHSARSQTIAEVARLCGELVLARPGSLPCFGEKLFELDHPLTENTQSVSVSFDSSHLLSTVIPGGAFSNPLVDSLATVGRVVRVLPIGGEHRCIPLPTDILLLIFENLCSPCRGWRRDILSAALVCRAWTCALDLLLIDFRSRDSQQYHPPEIASFASGLVARPSLGLNIRHLSADYLERHPSWDPNSAHPPGNPRPMFLAKLRLQRADLRRSCFADAFLSVLRAARNVQTLSLDTANPLVVRSDELADALSGLSALDTFSGKCPLTMAQLLHCIATWPSLKRLAIHSALSHSGTPPSTMPCRLTDLELGGVPVQDHELACLVSGAALERLKLDKITCLTNAGLAAALSTSCASLTYLHIMTLALERAPGEEHALDATIACMEQLSEMEVVGWVASERMLERRTEAFCQRTPPLPEIRLQVLGWAAWTSALDRSWAGWSVSHVEPRAVYDHGARYVFVGLE